MQTKQHRPSLFNDRVMSVPEAAALIGISPWTLERLAKAGKIKILKLSPRRKGIRLSEIDRYLEASETGPVLTATASAPSARTARRVSHPGLTMRYTSDGIYLPMMRHGARPERAKKRPLFRSSRSSPVSRSPSMAARSMGSRAKSLKELLDLRKLAVRASNRASTLTKTNGQRGRHDLRR